MGLTDRHKTAKNLVDSRKNWKIQGKKELKIGKFRVKKS